MSWDLSKSISSIFPISQIPSHLNGNWSGRVGKHKNRNGFLLTHGSTIFSRCAFLVKPHPVLRRRYSRWMFLMRLLFSFLSLFSPRLFPTWLTPLPRVYSLPRCVWSLLCSCARASANHYRGPDTTGVSIPITYPFVYFAALRITDLTVMPFCTERQDSLASYYTSCTSPALYWRSLLLRLYPIISLWLNQHDTKYYDTN